MACKLTKAFIHKKKKMNNERRMYFLVYRKITLRDRKTERKTERQKEGQKD
jgi:hypothetical protein